MKTVTIEGNEFEVPDKANWVARDQELWWFWFENKPILTSHSWRKNGGDMGIIFCAAFPGHSHSLREIK